MKFAFKNKWFFLVVLVWGIIFSVPKFRTILHAWCNGSPWIQFTVTPNDFWNAKFNLNPTELPMKVTDGNIVGLQIPKSLNDIDQLIHENPHMPWLVAFRLQATMSKFHNNRKGGELSDADVLLHVKSGIPSPETNHEKLNFSPAQIKQALALCQMGENLEPQNAYFSWMRAYFLLIDWQDEKAWQAFDDASHKTYWNNHFIDYENLYTQSFRKIVNRPLLPYERYSIPEGFGLNGFGAFSKTREIARVITWQGIKLNREGHHDLALGIWSNAYKTFTLAAQGEDNKIDYLVDEAVLELIATGASYPDRATLKKHPNELDLSYKKKNSLVLFAQKFHHPDLAKQLEGDWQENQSLRQRVVAVAASPAALLYTSYHGLDLTQLICAFIVSGVVLILLLLGTLFVWFVILGFNYFLHPQEVTAQKTRVANLWLNISGMAICNGLISFAGGLFVVYLITLMHNDDVSSGWTIAQLFYTSEYASAVDRIIETTWGFTVQGIDTPWRILILLTPLITGIFYVLYKRIDGHNKNTKHPVFSKSLRILYLLLVLTAWGSLVMISDYDLPQIVTAAGIISAFLIISFGWMFLKSSSTNFAEPLKLLQSIAIRLICINSILILVLLISQSTIGSRLQPWADNQLRGEMHEFHQVIDAPPAKR